MVRERLRSVSSSSLPYLTTTGRRDQVRRQGCFPLKVGPVSHLNKNGIIVRRSTDAEIFSKMKVNRNAQTQTVFAV